MDNYSFHIVQELVAPIGLTDFLALLIAVPDDW